MKSVVKVAIAGVVLVPSLAVASSMPDARSAGMGGTGVANGNYLSSSFHNPALASKYNDGDNFGLLLPVVGVTARDGNALVDNLSDFQDLTDDLAADPTNSVIQKEWEDSLLSMDGRTISSDLMIGGVVAIPNEYLSTNLFAQANVTVLGGALIDKDDIGRDVADLKSHAQVVAAGTIDVGLTFAKDVELAGRTVHLGVSPKYQTLVALNHIQGVSDFDDSNIDVGNDLVDKSAFNVDVGIAYNLFDDVTFGLAGRNIISNELKTNISEGQHLTYLVEPEYTMGLSYDTNFVSLAVDVDLNERKLFKEIDYSEQFARVGAEFDAWGWSQIRVGYIMSMTEHKDDVVTAGLGFKPFGLFGLDVAAQYGKNDDYGVSAQMVMNF